MNGTREKIVHFIGSSQKDLKGLPEDVRYEIGHSLYMAECGLMPDNAKALKGHKGAGVLEIVENDDGDTYRAVYTVRHEGVLYVLYAFKKKSLKGKATPQKDLDVVEERLKTARAHYEANYAPKKKKASAPKRKKTKRKK